MQRSPPGLFLAPQPIGMVVSVCASAAVGLWLTVGLLYYTPAYILSSSSTSTENPQGIGSFGTLFGMLQAATGSKQGTNALAVIILLTLFTSGPALVTVTTRLVFAMARDGALPFSRALRYLHPKTETPAWALFAVVCTVYVFVLIQLGSLTAFQSIVNPYVAYTQARAPECAWGRSGTESTLCPTPVYRLHTQSR